MNIMSFYMNPGEFIRAVVAVIEADLGGKTAITLSLPEQGYCNSMQRAGKTAKQVAEKIMFVRNATSQPVSKQTPPVHRRNQPSNSGNTSK